jgi:hypothetical protein
MFRVVVVLAVVDWLLAFGMTAVGVRRQVSVPLLATAAAVLIAFQAPRLAHIRRALRSAPDPGASRWSVVEAAAAQQWSPRIARLVLREPRLLWSLVLLVRGHRDGTPAATFSSYRDPLPVWVLLGVVALLEVLVTPMLPLPRAAHVALLVLGAWGLVVIVGLTAALVVHPHLVTPDVIRLRFGFWDEVVVPRTAVGRLHATAARAAPRGLRVADGEATLCPSGVTNIELDLVQPIVVRGEPVVRVRFWADAPRELAQARKS